jgi:hypothetical protein
VLLKKDSGGLPGCQSLDAGVQAALVAGGGVGVRNTLLYALVECKSFPNDHPSPIDGNKPVINLRSFSVDSKAHAFI